MERLWLEDPHGDPQEGPSSRSKQRPATGPCQHGGPATWGWAWAGGERRGPGEAGRGPLPASPTPAPVSPRECSQGLMKEVGQQLPR